MDYLVFRLYGPMASWGEIAVGEARHSAACPSKSALIGLLAAALGIRRDEEQRQQQLTQGYRIAVKQQAAGSLLRDYHTSQVPDSAGKRVYRTRRDELLFGRDRLGTQLSSREYRCDSKQLVALSALDGAPYTLAELQAALLRPRFQLSLGRKACVLAAPLAPELVDAPDLKRAFQQYPQRPILHDAGVESRWLADQQHGYYWEGAREALSTDDDLSGAQLLNRHDQPVSRSRWQFQPRQQWFWQEGES
ncbi:type I-E CRISPR-associated protein Cas5/CasD [Marinobacterium arenosum]|uniref:type I-E CRISPR-associated protein Cas5/CasD n=1 Tax=Marinobacterium arenosum TaxID=2862496 RepID=UPI001C94C385|nr:type I-E CRISPR-associated protein Cas5/CasD [Marinobacterium arenosum]MBY4678205.1 type I-E CRISPR-associated protein Cas5/CasD [Marinobacterium arenosum]